jgi:mRNA interferase MazF
MAGILRGDVRWANLSSTVGHEQASRRPVLILSRDEFNERSQTVIAVAMTSRPQKAGFPLTLRLADGTLPEESWVKISQVRTLSVERIGDRVARVDERVLSQVIEGLNELITV